MVERGRNWEQLVVESGGVWGGGEMGCAGSFGGEENRKVIDCDRQSLAD